MSEHPAIGIDIGGTRLKAALVSPNGLLSGQLVERSRMNEPYPAVRDQLASVIAALTIASDCTPVAVGIGVAGLMDGSRRRVIAAPNCPGVVGSPLVDDLERATGIAVVMDNDANVMALGEGASGAAKGIRHFLAVTLGTGVGGAVIYDGCLLRGASGGGGEIGHLCIDRHGPRCGCGSNGCLESFIGMKGIERWIARNVGGLRRIGMGGLSDLAQGGDTEAIRVFEFVGRTLGVALAGLVNVFNPQAIVVGGGIASAGPMLFNPLREEIARRAFRVYTEGLAISPAELGNWAGVVGAGMLRKGEG